MTPRFTASMVAGVDGGEAAHQQKLAARATDVLAATTEVPVQRLSPEFAELDAKR